MVGQANRATPDLKSDEPLAAAPARMPSLLKIVAVNGKRSEQLEQIARQADRQTQHGFELAGRGAYFAARLEFLGGAEDGGRRT